MRRHRPALATRVTAHQALACEPHQAATRPALSMWPSAGGPTRSAASGALPHVAQGGGLQSAPVNTVTGYLKFIEPLNVTNYPSWYKDVNVAIAVCEYDLALSQDKPAEPADPNGDRTVIEKWERSDRMANMIIKNTITLAIYGAIPDKNQDDNDLSGKAYLAKMEENFKSSSKTYASTLIMKMLTSQYDGQSGIREHIMSMCDMANKLKTLDMAISDGFLVHFIMTSLPVKYSPFKISYSTQKATWSMAELISYCVEEEEMQKAERMKDAVNMEQAA
ncbi:uncharacterized protein LOC120645645 [Panicum virgatum]|uniref:uncharacterized protein LOC120645645 n=1 Tax=Panicum virgatum TaxID=38727 RepID=UPI0019D679AD|nr:uncharacterized protein LOC120645645 [Panicum virgatum]